MSRNDNEQFVRDQFDQARPRYTRLVNNFVDDAEVVVEEAATIFDGMIPDMAYVDDHEKPMASAVFSCNRILAVYLALQKRGVDVHEFGSTMLSDLVNVPPAPAEEPEGEQPSWEERLAGLVAAGEASQREAAPGEFVFEVLPGDGAGESATNIKSCAICHAFSKYDAMDLVPYMCATDDVMSDRNNLGLRRTGTIAVGAEQCDFRYRRGGEPQHLAGLYPQQIRIAQG